MWRDLYFYGLKVSIALGRYRKPAYGEMINLDISTDYESVNFDLSLEEATRLRDILNERLA